MQTGTTDYRRVRGADPDLLRESLLDAAADCTFRPNGKHPFSFELELAKLEHAALFSISVSPMTVDMPVVDDFLSVAIPVRGGYRAATSAGLQSFSDDSCHVLLPDTAFNLRTDYDGACLVVNVERTFLSDHARSLDASPDRLPESLSLQTDPGARLKRYVDFVWRELQTSRGHFGTRQTLVELESSLTTLLLLALHDEPRQVQKPVPAYLRRAEDYIEAHMTEPLRVADLAQAAGVGLRTLFRAFHERHGVGPMTFLRKRRLEAVRRVLRESERAGTKVTDIALRHGFTHLGRFSSSYRAAFGEAPSETLRT